MNNPISELKQVHPAVAKWLTENGYSFEHEVKLAEYGRIDFVATHTSKPSLAIECKVKLDRSTGRACVQLIDYRRQLGTSYKPAIAVPSGVATDDAKAILRKYKIMLIEVEITPLQFFEHDDLVTIRSHASGAMLGHWLYQHKDKDEAERFLEFCIGKYIQDIAQWAINHQYQRSELLYLAYSDLRTLLSQSPKKAQEYAVLTISLYDKLVWASKPEAQDSVSKILSDLNLPIELRETLQELLSDLPIELPAPKRDQLELGD